MFQIKNRLQLSFFSDRDIARISSKEEKKKFSIVAVPIHSLKFIPSIRNKLNNLRRKEILLEKATDKKLAIFIPYRNRAQHLEEFIPQICIFLEKKKINYHIFVIEQKGEGFFNRGALLNLGVREFGHKFDYFCFHDVDLIPINADYSYYNQPIRLVSFIAESKTQIPKELGKGIYNHHFGGIVSITKKIFLDINGFSNLYHHYGLEDDDFFFRLLLKKYIPCKDLSGYYLAFPHYASKKILPSGKISSNFLEKIKLKNQLKKNRKLFSLIKRGLRNPFLEGLNDLFYKIENIKQEKKYTFCSAYLLDKAASQ